jgi:POT family proton-dependent oligopeptide transporter
VKQSRVQVDRVIAMLIIFAFNVLFWMFYFQLGTSFNFLAQNLVDRKMFGGWEFPTGWFQSVSPLAIILLAPVVTLVWSFLAARRSEPSIPRKFGFGLVFNGLGFAVLMYALSHLLNGQGLIPFWPLAICYVMQTIGELCLSPIGLSMVTKLAPQRVTSLMMALWFFATAISEFLAGHLASFTDRVARGELFHVFGGQADFFLIFVVSSTAAGVAIFALTPLLNRLTHGRDV